jgi:hopanoid biosynthesis associated protein HpnK
VKNGCSNANGLRRLIVNADDFGRSTAINQAVRAAHTDGILTTASLMVAEPGCEEAVGMARAHPALGVGLHLTLLLGRSALPAKRVPDLVDGNGVFRSGPVGSGLRFFFYRSLREQLRAELHEQFRRFRQTGLRLDHVNGHLHLHLHPVVLDLLMQDAAVLGLERMRLTSDPLRLNLALDRGRYADRLSHAVIYRLLSARARRAFARLGIGHTDRVFGLLQNARVDESYVLRLLERLPTGDSELYSHPSLDDFRHELDALISPAVTAEIERRGIRLIRYQDL